MRAAKKVMMCSLVFLGGCAHVGVEYTAINAPPRPLQPKSPDTVQVFTSQAPERKYVEIGTLTAMHDSVASNADMFAQLKVEAAKRGCDGVVITQRDDAAAIGACVVYADP